MASARQMAAVQRSHGLPLRRALVAAVASGVPVPGWTGRWTPPCPRAYCSKSAPSLARAGAVGPTPPHKHEGTKSDDSGGLGADRQVRHPEGRAARGTRQLAKYVPLAGQAVSATLGYASLRYLGEQHLRDCVRVAQVAELALPPPR